MDTVELLKRRGQAVVDFDEHEHFHGGDRVLEGLSAGLTQLREALYTRVHDDVERRIGMDSMLAPISEDRSAKALRLEIEIFQIVISSQMVAAHQYVHGDQVVHDDAEWYSHWLSEYRLGRAHDDVRVTRRLEFYHVRSPSEQRLAFSNALMQILPEARRAPLVLYRLIAPAVRIVTSLAFGKTADALDCRREQQEYLPSIVDCHRCRGKLLENGESCQICGNPLWNYEWLTASDT